MGISRNRTTDEALVLRFSVCLCDLVLLFGATLLVFRLFPLATDVWRVMLVSAAAYIVALALVPPVLFERLVCGHTIVGRLVRLCLLYAVLLVFGLFLCGFGGLTRAYVGLSVGLFAVGLTAERLLLRWAVARLRRAGRNRMSVVLVGSPSEASDIIALMRRPACGYLLRGIFFDGDEDAQGLKRLGTVGQAQSYLETKRTPDIVVCTERDVDDTTLGALFESCEDQMLPLYIYPRKVSALAHRMDIRNLDSLCALTARPEPLRQLGWRLLKRVFDIAVSALFLLTLFPIIYLAVFIAVKATGKGQVFQVETLAGSDGHIFRALRFRLPDTKWVRRLHVDVLPRFFAILKGDMSVVGPRPNTPAEAGDYGRRMKRFPVRRVMRPGLTGWTQTERPAIGREQGDAWYMEHWNFWLDIQIILRTLSRVVKG